MEPIVIRLDPLSQITLRVEDILPRPPHRGSVAASAVRLAVEVQTPDLSGRLRFSVLGSTMSRWRADLDTFERVRTGDVLLADDDDAFWLRLSATDRAGHLDMSLELHWGGAIASRLSTDPRWERTLALNGMPKDPAVLLGIVNSVRALYQAVVAQHSPRQR
jgi:hypothetical protein